MTPTNTGAEGFALLAAWLLLIAATSGFAGLLAVWLLRHYGALP